MFCTFILSNDEFLNYALSQKKTQAVKFCSKFFNNFQIFPLHIGSKFAIKDSYKKFNFT